MNGFPVLFDLRQKRVTVVGAGTVGQRKTTNLLACGAHVRLISLTAPTIDWLDEVEFRQKPFTVEDLDGAVLAFAATGVDEVDRSILAAARERRIPANLANRPEQGDFHVPARLQQGDLQIAIATGGQSPLLARLLRDHLADQFGPEWAILVEIAGRLRQRKLTDFDSTTYTYKVLENLLNDGLPELIARRDATAIDALLERATGTALTLTELGVELPVDETP